jgi:hypothetical protein
MGVMPENMKVYKQNTAALPTLVMVPKTNTPARSENKQPGAQVQLDTTPDMEKLVQRLIEYINDAD